MAELTLDDGLRLAYQVDGDPAAPPLVFLNSLGTDLRVWDAQVAALGAHFHIIRYDTRGHGRSGVPDSPATIVRLGQDLLALLDRLAIARAHLCGLSLGGMTALWASARHAERVDRAVFANTAARIGSVESWDARIAAVRAGGMAAVREVVVARFLSAAFRARHPPVAQALGDMLEATDPQGYLAACAVLRDTDLHPLLPLIRAPALILAGAWDEPTPPAQAADLQASIAGSRLVVLPDTAHLSNIEQPDRFNECVLQFLADYGLTPML